MRPKSRSCRDSASKRSSPNDFRLSAFSLRLRVDGRELVKPNETIVRDLQRSGARRRIGGGHRPRRAVAFPTEGVFSDAQATRGEDAYTSRCAQCHGDDLIAKEAESPSLTGLSFKTWVGKTLADASRLFAPRCRQTSPGSLDDQTSIDVVTFILEVQRISGGLAGSPARQRRSREARASTQPPKAGRLSSIRTRIGRGVSVWLLLLAPGPLFDGLVATHDSPRPWRP